MGLDEFGPSIIEPPAGGDHGAIVKYANGVNVLHQTPHRPSISIRGVDGSLMLTYGHLTSNKPEIIEEPLGEKERRVPSSKNALVSWLDAIRANKPEAVSCRPEIGHRAASACHVLNIAYKLRRKLRWNPVTEEFVDDAEANALRSRTPREGWEYPV